MCVSPSTEGSRSPHSSSSTRLLSFWPEPSDTKHDTFLKRRPSPHLAPWYNQKQMLVWVKYTQGISHSCSKCYYEELLGCINNPSKDFKLFFLALCNWFLVSNKKAKQKQSKQKIIFSEVHQHFKVLRRFRHGNTSNAEGGVGNRKNKRKNKWEKREKEREKKKVRKYNMVECIILKGWDKRKKKRDGECCHLFCIYDIFFTFWILTIPWRSPYHLPQDKPFIRKLVRLKVSGHTTKRNSRSHLHLHVLVLGGTVTTCLSCETANILDSLSLHPFECQRRQDGFAIDPPHKELKHRRNILFPCELGLLYVSLSDLYRPPYLCLRLQATFDTQSLNSVKLHCGLCRHLAVSRKDNVMFCCFDCDPVFLWSIVSPSMPDVYIIHCCIVLWYGMVWCGVVWNGCFACLPHLRWCHCASCRVVIQEPPFTDVSLL